MHRTHTSTFQSTHQNIPTLLSIEAQSEISVDLRPNELQPLISQIFLLCIELQRKDMIIDQLQTEGRMKDQMKKSHIDMANRDLHVRYDRLELENRGLIQANVMLKNSVANLERLVADLQVHKQRSAYNKDLQQKLYILELKLKKSQQQKIEYLQRQKSLKRQNSMLSYSVIKTSQKNRIRDLQSELSQQRMKLEAEKRLTADLKYQVEKDLGEIKGLKEVEYGLRRNLEECLEKVGRLERVERDRVVEDMRKSQFTAANQEKIVLLSQQLNRLRQQIQILKSTLKTEHQKSLQKDTLQKTLTQQLQTLQQTHSTSLQTHTQTIQSLQSLQTQSHKKQLQLLNQIQILEQSLKNMKISQNDLELYLKQKILEEQDRVREVDRLRVELGESQRLREEGLGELRKVRRRVVQDCEICRIRSTTVIPSSKSIGGGMRSTMNLQEIIQQTQKLNLSNKKIESLINHHEIITQQTSSQNTILNITQ